MKQKISIQKIAGLAVKGEETWESVLDAGEGKKDIDQGLLGNGPYIFDEEKSLWQPITCKFLTLTLLDNVTETGVGDSFELPRVFKNYAWEIIIAGNPSAVEVDLEGSIDGTNWFVIDTSYTITKELRYVSDKQIAYVRANLITLEGAGGYSTAMSVEESFPAAVAPITTVTVIFRGGASNV